MRVWIDTDIGDDIDDALALLLGMAEPDIEIAGVSTVFCNTHARGQIAKTLLEKGKCGDIPVYEGIGRPRHVTKVFNYEIDLEKLPKTYMKNLFEKADTDGQDGVYALKEQLEKGGLTIVSMGALTNIAELIEKYPDVAKNIKCLHIMGGARLKNLNEFNISCDPHAASVVFNSPIPKKIVTLDVTFDCELSREQTDRLRRCKSQLMKIIISMSDFWENKMILHDPLTLATVLRDDLVEFAPSNLYVETQEGYSIGKCVDLCDFNWRMESHNDMLVSVSVNAARFLDYFIDKICAFDKRLLEDR